MYELSTPLVDAAQCGNLRLIRSLVTHGYSVNESDFGLVTPLHAASMGGYALCIQELLELGARVDSRDIDGTTPLCEACTNGSIECINLLLDAGAEVNPQALQSGSFRLPLHKAVIRSANVDAPKNQETALHIAARNNCTKLCRLFLEFGANACAKNVQGCTARSLVPSPSTILHDLLHLHEVTPLSLRQLCRLAVRKLILSQGNNASIIENQLPLLLKNYIKYV